ncbi:insulinase family protein [Candidatus Microgenomates bacterium]|nr:insulinase family protein [Candidatus Microgenomates bacterium]
MEHSVEEVTLKNGMAGLLIRVPGSKVVNFSIGFRAGFAYSKPKTWEMPHLLEHTIFCANAEYDDKIEFQAEIEKNGAEFHAYTDRYLINYAGEAATIEDTRVLHLVNLAIGTVKLKDDEVASEISNVREELKMRLSEHDVTAYEVLVDQMTDQRTREQGLTSLANITPAALRRYHQATHTQGNLRFVLGGDLRHSQRLLQQLEDELSMLRVVPQPTIPAEHIVGLTKPVILKRRIQQIYYEIHHYFGTTAPVEWAAKVVLRTILAGRWKSWIYGEARRRGLAYHVGLSIDAEPHYSLSRLAAFVTPENITPLFELFRDKLLQAKRGDFSEAEIEEAKLYLIGSRLRAYKTPGSLVGWYAGDYFVHDFKGTFQQFQTAIEQVSRQDLIELVTKMFAQPKWGVSFVGNITEAKARELHGVLAEIWN